MAANGIVLASDRIHRTIWATGLAMQVNRQIGTIVVVTGGVREDGVTATLKRLGPSMSPAGHPSYDTSWPKHRG